MGQVFPRTETGAKQESMSGSIRLALMLFAAVVVIYYGVRLVLAVVSFFVPVLVVIGIAAILYVVVNRKALSSGSRRLLP